MTCQNFRQWKNAKECITWIEVIKPTKMWIWSRTICGIKTIIHLRILDNKESQR